MAAGVVEIADCYDVQPIASVFNILARLPSFELKVCQQIHQESVGETTMTLVGTWHQRGKLDVIKTHASESYVTNLYCWGK